MSYLIDDLPRVGLLGGGQLGRMLAEEANNLNIPIRVLDSPNAPAKQVHSHPKHVNGSFANAEAVRELADDCDLLTVEIEHVDTDILEELSHGDVRIEPSWRTIRIIQDKFEQKQHLKRNNVQTADAIVVNSERDLGFAAQELGYPFMLKARKQAYDGRGNRAVRSESDLRNAMAELGTGGLYAERWMNFRKELAVMVVKTKDDVLAYPTVETIQENSICKLVYAPARGISQDVAQAAQNLAKRAVHAFPGKGVFGVEMFLLPDNTVQVLEIAPRVHNSGHYTIEACGMSQFAAHLRAILDLPIPEKSLKLRSPAVMLNILGGAAPQSHQKLVGRALRVPNAWCHLYGKGDARPGRKMGHITVVGTSMSEAENAIYPLLQAFDTLQRERSDIDHSHLAEPISAAPGFQSVVGVTAGSQSDQNVLQTCYDVLSKLQIPFERRITSAHRSPELMASYAKDAEARGIKVLIAAAGGAAHLPGMVAAFSRVIPVVGLPIKPSVGDGMDSLLSMTNMPRGTPVLTVGVNNGVNAALVAARILAMWDNDLRDRLIAYAGEAERESRENDRKLQEISNSEITEP
ncbi:MAG: phosphoribosylaminoimidazole carboxylase ade2 [Bathelium mastoideum]|nr:MAG: phosphoribosylaminoimidazole carboxylase ade2 [Bathelium mastoideum]